MTKNQSLKFGFIFCLVVCLPLLSLGGTADWQRTFSYSKFSHVSFPHSASTTTSACMQENGMLWFGTRQGLFNFNGYGLHRITNGNNPAANSIQTVIEVGRNLCVGTDQGVCWFNLDTYHFGNRYPSLSGVGPVRSLLSVDNDLLIGSRDNGLFLLNMSNGHLRRLPCRGRATTLVYNLAYTGNGIVYVGAYEGLSRLDLRSCRQTPVAVKGLKSRSVNSLYYEAKTKTLWLGLLDGLVRMQLQSGTAENVAGMRGAAVRSIAEDLDGNLLIGTENGLYVYSSATHQITRYYHNIQNPFSISNNSIWNVLCDRQGNTWLCTEDGISYSQSRTWLHEIPLSTLTAQEDGNAFSTMLVDSHGTVWAGGDNGLLCLPASGGKPIWFKQGDAVHHLPNNRIRNIYEDREHVIWITTDAGFGYYDSSSQQFHFTILHDGKGRSSQWAYALTEDAVGRMWVTTYKGGLYVVGRATLIHGTPGIFNSNAFAPYDSITNTIYQAFADGRGNLWVNSDKGMAEINMGTRQVSLKQVYMDRMVLVGNIIWLTSQGAIYRYNTLTGENQKLPFQDKNGLILTLVPAKDRVWFTTSNGVYYVNVRDNTVHNCYFTKDSYLSGCYDAQSDRLIWGKKDALDILDLAKVDRLDYRRRVMVTAVTQGDSLLLPGDGYSLDCHGKDICLKTRDNVTLEVSAFSYSPQSKEVLYYRLGTDKPWQELSDGQNKINLSELGGGSYTLQLSFTDPAIDSKALINSYTLHIPYPWFLRWYMVTIYVVLVLVLLNIIIRYERQRGKVRYEELERQRVMELSRQKMDFFINVSHELKTPLSLIIAPVSKLLAETRSNGKKQILQLVYKNALRLNALIAQILDFKSMEFESNDTLIRSNVEVNALMADCIGNFKTETDSRGIKVCFHASTEKIWMNLDSVKMESVVTNLLSNAIKYVPDQTGEIHVTTALDKEALTIDIKDNGAGIDKDELPMIFVRYFQGKNSRKKGGTGIGMYLVRKFVQLHGGTVEANNNHGLDIRISIPATGDNALADNSQTCKAVPKDEKAKQTILIIDDNAEILDFLRISLSGNYRCQTAVNGKEGLEVASQCNPDLIIVDEMMPVMDGQEFCRQARKTTSLEDVPIIMLTAKSDPDTELESIRNGVDVFLPKPFDLKKLQLHIVQFLKRSESIRHHERIASISQPDFKKDTLKVSGADTSEKFLSAITTIIEENIDDESFNVTALAEKTGMEPKQLYRKVKQITGCTPIAYLKKLRMKKAAVLLEGKTFSVSEVMYMVGYTNASYFSKCFAEEFGVSPKDYRLKQR